MSGMYASPPVAAHDARGCFLWQSAGFLAAKPIPLGMIGMRDWRIGVDASAAWKLRRMIGRSMPDRARTESRCTCRDDQSAPRAERPTTAFDMSARFRYFLRRKLANCISRRKGLRNHENCGLTATRTFESS
jgi:hypothetical protein